MGQRYAVLISSSATPFHVEFFFDVVNMRQSLLNYGFAANNIFVLYGNGNDLADAAYPAAKYNFNPAITDMAATIANVQQIFSDLSAGTNGFPQVTNQDLLFVYTFDHGGDKEPIGSPISTLCLNDGNMRADDFATALNQVAYAYRVFCMQQCFSGGFIPHLRNDRTVILTAADFDEVANPTDTEQETIADPVLGNVVYPHGEFNWHLFSALDGQSLDGFVVNADTDGNTFLTMREVFDYIAGMESRPETPQYDDGSRDIGERLRLNAIALMDIRFIVERSTLGEDEINARRAAGSAVVADAFRVVVDGFTAAEIGITGPDSTLAYAPSLTGGGGITIKPMGNTSDSGAYGPEEQRFTFNYDLDFGPYNDAFNFPDETKLITLNVEFATFSASAQIELIKQPNPFILHGDTSWLSIDLRVFVVRAGETKFGVTMGNDASNAPGFIQDVMKALTDGKGVADGQSFNSLSTDQEESSLYLQPTDGSGDKVFNFALAKVHYIGTIGAANVRVFFRLLSTQSTSFAYDIPPGNVYPMTGSYRFWSDGTLGGKKIPLAGIQGNDYVTIPCFALPRVDTVSTSMTLQDDSRTDSGGNVFGNVQSITPNTDGSEVDTFFGCWLDTNQPFKPNGVDPNNVLPISLAGAVDGPFSAADTPLSIQQSIIRNGHQCLIAEIAFDPVEIPVGKDPSNWDKLAQRNIAWSDIGSAQALSTFEIRPTPATAIQLGQMPDELMIDWGNTPSGSLATIYLPAVSVADILAMADRMYTTHRLELADSHTLQCTTGGITYIPIPAGADINYAGLLSVDLPATVKMGQVFTIVVRQVTNAFGYSPPEPPRIAETMSIEAAIVRPDIEWRQVLGAFQLTIPVHGKEMLLSQEERQLSVFRWIEQAIPPDNRWYSVFNRYVGQIASRVDAFGGDSSQIAASPTGDWQTIKAKRCRRLAIINAVLLVFFIVALGALSGMTALAIAVFLAVAAFAWVSQCQPKFCRLLRTFVAGAGSGALILAILSLLGVSAPQLIAVLTVTVVMAAIAGVVGIFSECF